jgi:hypothetical protein
MEKRVLKEIDLFINSGYIIDKNEIINNPTIYQLLIVSKNTRTFEIKLPKNYPFKSPIINDMIFNDTILTSATKLVDIINVYFMDNPTMLVYCHPRIIDLKKEGTHWSDGVFKSLLIRDNLPLDSTQIISLDINTGGTVKANGFDSDFIH